MWRLKVGEGKGPWLKSISNFHGRRYWIFNPNDGTEEEHAQVEKFREDYTRKRSENGIRQSANLLMRMQFIKENGGALVNFDNNGEMEDQPIEDDVTEEVIAKGLRKGIDYFTLLQASDGHWPSDLPGPLFIGPLLIIALYITGDLYTFFSSEHQKELKRYIYNHQNNDGGWGFHIEGESTMFGSVLNYVALRLLGVELIGDDVESKAAARGQNWILDHGGALATPSWGKFWLAQGMHLVEGSFDDYKSLLNVYMVELWLKGSGDARTEFLGVYEWSGCYPILPEIWLLPTFFPLNPGKLLSFCRLTYLPMSYMYGKRFVGPTTYLVRSLRRELYIEPYEEINWAKASSTCAEEDQYRPLSYALKWSWAFLRGIEPIWMSWPGSIFRERALKIAAEHIHYEDIASRYFSIGSVEKVLSLLACWAEDPNSEEYKSHLPRVHDYLWLAEDGMTMVGNLSQLWDVSFTVQAIISSGFTSEYWNTLVKAYDYVIKTQIHENPPGDYTKMYRHPTKGAWSFMDVDIGWQVSDCTAEGLKAALILSQVIGEEFNKQYAYDAVDIILSFPSSNGGFPAWEPARASGWVEVLNPVEFFEDTLIEREYVECTSSAVQALLQFTKLHSNYRNKDIQTCISNAIKYIECDQCPDGSWFGRWGLCYTYATWFAVDALVACGKSYRSSTCLQKACTFLLSKQLPCGGWGESYLSSHNKIYTNLDGDRAHVVHTAWALLSLMKVGQAEIDPTPIHRGIKALLSFQMSDGDFPQQEATGLFMRYCILSYSSYRNIFAIWALAEYQKWLLSL